MPTNTPASPPTTTASSLQRQLNNTYNRLTSPERHYLARYTVFQQIPIHQRSTQLHHCYTLLNRLAAYQAGTHHIASDPTTPRHSSNMQPSYSSPRLLADTPPTLHEQSSNETTNSNITTHHPKLLPDERTLRRFRRQKIRDEQHQLLRSYPTADSDRQSSSSISPARVVSPPMATTNTNLSIHRTSQQSQLRRTTPTHNVLDTTTNTNKQPLAHNAKTAPLHTPQAPHTTTTPSRRSSTISHTPSPHTTHVTPNIIQPQHTNLRQTLTNNQFRTPPPPPNNTDRVWTTPTFLTPHDNSPISPQPNQLPQSPSQHSVISRDFRPHTPYLTTTMSSATSPTHAITKSSTSYTTNTSNTYNNNPQPPSKQNNQPTTTTTSHNQHTTQPYIPHHRRSPTSHIQANHPSHLSPYTPTSLEHHINPNHTSNDQHHLSHHSPPFFTLDATHPTHRNASLFNTMPMHNPTINEKLQPPINRTDTPLTAVHTRNTHSTTMANTDMLQPDPTHISTDEIQQEADTSGILRTEFNNFPRIPNNQLNERLVLSLLERIATQLARDSSHTQNCREAECIRTLRNAFNWRRLALWLRTYTDKSIRLSYPRTEYWTRLYDTNVHYCHQQQPEQLDLATAIQRLTNATQRTPATQSFTPHYNNQRTGAYQPSFNRPFQPTIHQRPTITYNPYRTNSNIPPPYNTFRQPFSSPRPQYATSRSPFRPQQQPQPYRPPTHSFQSSPPQQRSPPFNHNPNQSSRPFNYRPPFHRPNRPPFRLPHRPFVNVNTLDTYDDNSCITEQHHIPQHTDDSIQTHMDFENHGGTYDIDSLQQTTEEIPHSLDIPPLQQNTPCSPYTTLYPDEYTSTTYPDPNAYPFDPSPSHEYTEQSHLFDDEHYMSHFP